MSGGRRHALTWVVSLIVTGALWKWTSTDGLLSALLLPPPEHVLASVWHEVLTDPTVLPLTLLRTTVGTALGLAFGAFLAMASYLVPSLEQITRLFSMLLRCVPIMALIPTITVLVGYGGTAAVATTLMMSFFPAFALVSGALRRIPVGYLRLSSASGGTRWRFLWHVGVPMALPDFVLSVRLTACLAVIACTTAEFLTANDGLGALLARAQALLATETLWAVLLVSTLCALLCWSGGDVLDRRVRDRLCADRQ